MSGLSDLLYMAGEAELNELRKSVCRTPAEDAAFNCAVSQRPQLPESGNSGRFQRPGSRKNEELVGSR
jgi:hypothetical protein